jgi:hypothetical protein
VTEVNEQDGVLSSTVERLAAGGFALAGLGVLFVVRQFNPATAGFFPLCPFFQITGLHCPGCGLTRGFHALLQGDVVGALDYNALLPLYAGFFGYVFVSLLLTVFRGRGLKFTAWKPLYVWGFLGLSLVFAVVRNLPFYPVSVLAP